MRKRQRRFPQFSRFSLPSFILGSIGMVIDLGFVLIAWLVVLNWPQLDQVNSGIALLQGVVVMSGLTVNIIGLAFGASSLLQSSGKKVYALFGILLNLTPLILLIGFAMLAVLSQHYNLSPN